jgi:hypothetical protein
MDRRTDIAVHWICVIVIVAVTAIVVAYVVAGKSCRAKVAASEINSQ